VKLHLQQSRSCNVVPNCLFLGTVLTVGQVRWATSVFFQATSHKIATCHYFQCPCYKHVHIVVAHTNL